MRERYGSVTAQQLADIDWIRDATSQGEVLLTGDKAIAKRPLEARAVLKAGARVFALGSSQLAGRDKGKRLLDHEGAIFRRARATAGPYIFSVTGHGLQKLKLLA